MHDKNIVCFTDLDEKGRQEAVEVFVDGFGHMLTFAKTKDELLRLYAEAFEEELVYVYVINNRIGGIIGLGTNTKRPIKIDKQLCEELFGTRKGRMVYNMILKRDEKPAVKKATDLYVDFLATNVKMRKQGIATKMLAFACEMPQYNEIYLDVLSKNVSAIKLYENLEFVVYKKTFNIFTFTQGLGRPLLMKKPTAK